MLEDGGMLVQPSMTGKRPGYRGDAAARSSGAADSGRVGGSDVGESSTSSDSRDDGPDDRGSDVQNAVQAAIRAGVSPKDINRITNPSVIDKVRSSRFNNPITRGILRTGLYTLNPALGPLDFRKAMQLKGLYDTTKEGIYGDVDMDDITLGLITDQQKQIIDKQGNIGKLTGAFDPDQTFEAAKKFDDEGGFFRDAEPMTREEFNTYISEKGYANGGRIGFKGGADAATASFGASVGYSDPETGSTGRDDPDDGFDLGGGQGPTFDGAEATIVTGDDFRKAQEAIGKSKLQSLYKTGVPKSNLPGLLGLGLNATKKLRDFTLRKNIEYFEDLSTSKYPKTLEGYTQYMQDRSAGLIDAAGNPKTRFDDNDSFTPVDTTFAQAPTEEEVLSPIQQAILDRGTPSAFLAEGGMPKDAPVGGIMDLESGRQMYFLGKLVKKATRAVKKIVKSPIGKAALFAAPFLMNPALRTGIGTFLKTKAAPFLFKDTSGSFMDMLTGGLTGKGSLALGGALTLAPLLFQEDTNDDEYQKFLRERGAGAQLPAPIPTIRNQYRDYMARAFVADGGTPEPVAKKTMPLLDMDGKEMDLRAEGGFVPIGRMEKADDVPARLSKNEFVFTADAVRNAGDGDVDKGAEVMYNMMKNLESGGDVSEESQGLEGARRMFQTSQRLEEVL
jgi:hypothetical protein